MYLYVSSKWFITKKLNDTQKVSKHFELWCSVQNDDLLNSLRPRQNGCQFADNIFKFKFYSVNIDVFSFKIQWTMFVTKGTIDSNQVLVKIMA